MKQYAMLRDSELISQCRNGSDDAMEWLVQKHSGKLFDFILGKVKDRHQAEDIFQDVIIRLIVLIRNGHYTDNGKFTHWARHIAFNMCIDHFRRKKRSRYATNGDGHEFFDTFHFSSEGIDLKLITTERRDLIAKTLSLLPEDQRRVIVMRHYGECSFREIASVTNCSVNTALGRMRYGLMNMRKMIGGKAVG